MIRATLAALGGEEAVRRTRLGPWWAAWLVSSVLSQIESRLVLSNGLTAEPPPSSYVVGMFASLAGVVAALLCARVVSTVQACLDQPEPSQPVAAAGDPRPGRFTGPRTQTLSRT